MNSAAVSTEDFRLLRNYIEQHCGIALGDEKAYLINTRLTKLMVESGCEDFGAFYRLAKNSVNGTLRDKIIDAITTNETLWFRDTHPFAILREKLIPPLAEEIRAGKRQRIRIWSAASSTGQEPYSIAIAIQEMCRITSGLTPEHFEILGTDISSAALFLAKTGRYDQIAMSRGLPDDVRDRYFQSSTPAGGTAKTWTLNDNIKRMVAFKRFNLQDSARPFGHFDVVFLRYVAIYFSEDFKRQVFAELARALSPGGHLIIGAVESLRGYSDAFRSLSHAGGTYYQCTI